MDEPTCSHLNNRVHDTEYDHSHSEDCCSSMTTTEPYSTTVIVKDTNSPVHSQHSTMAYFAQNSKRRKRRLFCLPRLSYHEFSFSLCGVLLILAVLTDLSAGELLVDKKKSNQALSINGTKNSWLSSLSGYYSSSPNDQLLSTSSSGGAVAITLYDRIKRATKSDDERFLDFGFSKEPSDIIVAKGGSGHFDCETYGPRPSTIEWRKDGNLLNVDDTSRLSVHSNGSLILSGVVGHRGGDAGRYQCVAVVDHLGSAWRFVSRVARLQVATLPRFEEQPESREVSVGDVVVLRCVVSAVPPAVVKWYKDKNPIDLVALGSRVTLIDGTGSLEIRGVQASDEGDYKCHVSNPDKERFSREGHLTVISPQFLASPTEPSFETKPSPGVFKRGERAVLQCAANGYPEPDIVWLKDRTNIELDGARVRVVGQGTLVLSELTAEDAGTYICRASNDEDTVDASATLEVSVAPTFAVLPVNVLSKETADVEFDCQVDGRPGPSVTWYKNGETFEPSPFFVMEGSKLRVQGLLQADQGVYTCLAENGAGSAQASAQLIVQVADQTTTAAPHGSAPNSSPDGPPETPNGGDPPPSEPLSLHSLLTTGRSVKLRWDPPLQTNGDVLAYTIFYKMDASSRERAVNSTGSKREMMISGLQPDALYHFRAVAWNSNGAGLSSSPLTVRTKQERAVPGKVRNLNGWALSPTKVEVKWDPPSSDPIQHYSLYYIKSSEKSESSGGQDSETLIDQIQRNYYTLHGLDEFTSYSFRIEAVNQNGPGLSSETVVVQTLSDVPTAAPLDVKAEYIGTGRVKMEWSPPPVEDRNGVITGYKIKYKERKRGAQGHNYVTEGNVFMHEIENLDEGKTYMFRVAAVTVNGTGPASPWIRVSVIRASDDGQESNFPGAPTSLRVEAKSHSITMSWTPPLNDGIKVRGYLIGWGVNIPDVHRKRVDESARYFVIENLQPNREYIISLKAINRVGTGYPIFETVRTEERQQDTDMGTRDLEPPIGLQAMKLSPESVRLSWVDRDIPQMPSGGAQRASDGRYYTVQYTSPNWSGETRRYKLINTTETQLTVLDLRPAYRYEFEVRVGWGRSHSKWSMAAVVTMDSAEPTSPPSDVTLVRAPGGDPTAVGVNWMRPKYENGKITEYMVLYSTDSDLPDDDWQQKIVDGTTMSTIIYNLDKGKTYFFRVQAKNSVGIGPPSAAKLYSTSGAGAVVSGAGDKGSGGTDKNLLIVVVIAAVAVVLILILVGVGITCCRRRRRKRDGYTAGKRTYTTSAQPVPMPGVGHHRGDSKPPPDLWMKERPSADWSKQSPGDSMHDLKLALHQHTPSPNNVDDPPRYHTLVDGHPMDPATMSRSAVDLGYTENEVITMMAIESSRRRVGHARPFVVTAPNGGRVSSAAHSDVEGSNMGTLTRSYHQSSGSLEQAPPGAGRHQRTPQVVYTGPRNQQPAKTVVAFQDTHMAVHSPYGSGSVGMTPTPPPQLPNGGPPPCPPSQQHSYPQTVSGGTLTRHHQHQPASASENNNPLKSFAATAPGPPPSAGGASPQPPRTHVVRPITVVAAGSPHHHRAVSVGTTAGGKPAGIVIGTRSAAPSTSVVVTRPYHSPRVPPTYHQHNGGSMSDTHGHSSGKETDGEDGPILHSYSTEELNNQIENLDTLMEDLQSMSKNEFNVV